MPSNRTPRDTSAQRIEQVELERLDPRLLTERECDMRAADAVWPADQDRQR